LLRKTKISLKAYGRIGNSNSQKVNVRSLAHQWHFTMLCDSSMNEETGAIKLAANNMASKRRSPNSVCPLHFSIAFFFSTPPLGFKRPLIRPTNRCPGLLLQFLDVRRNLHVIDVVVCAIALLRQENITSGVVGSLPYAPYCKQCALLRCQHGGGVNKWRQRTALRAVPLTLSQWAHFMACGLINALIPWPC